MTTMNRKTRKATAKAEATLTALCEALLTRVEVIEDAYRDEIRAGSEDARFARDYAIRDVTEQHLVEVRRIAAMLGR